MLSIRYLVWVMFLTLICANQSYARNVKREFLNTSKQVLNSLSTGDWKQLATYTSSSGLLFVNRQLDWDATLNRQKRNEKPKSSATTLVRDKYLYTLNFDNLDAITWHEQQIYFLKQEINSPSYIRLIQQMQSIIRGTEDGYRSSIESSLNIRDPWGLSPIGPALAGKIASNSWWYVYFRREGNKGLWRMWKIEVFVH